MIYAILWYSHLFHPRILHPMFPQDALIWGPWKLLTEAQRPSFWQGPSFPNGSSHASESTWAACADGCLFDVERDPTEQRNLYRETWEEHLRNLEKKNNLDHPVLGLQTQGFLRRANTLSNMIWRADLRGFWWFSEVVGNSFDAIILARGFLAIQILPLESPSSLENIVFRTWELQYLHHFLWVVFGESREI